MKLLYFIFVFIILFFLFLKAISGDVDCIIKSQEIEKINSKVIHGNCTEINTGTVDVCCYYSYDLKQLPNFSQGCFLADGYTPETLITSIKHWEKGNQEDAYNIITDCGTVAEICRNTSIINDFNDCVYSVNLTKPFSCCLVILPDDTKYCYPVIATSNETLTKFQRQLMEELKLKDEYPNIQCSQYPFIPSGEFHLAYIFLIFLLVLII